MRTRSALAGPALIALVFVLLTSACGFSSDGAGATIVRSDDSVSTSIDHPDATTTTADIPDDVPDDATTPAALVATSWLLDSHLTVGGLQAYPAGTRAGVSFTVDGRIELDTDCNSGSAPVTFDRDEDGTMLVGPLTMTERACLDEVDAALERSLVSILAEPLTWSAHDGVLVLTPQHISDTGLLFVAA